MENKYKFHRVDPDNNIDVWEDVAPEVWRWEVIYQDGSVFKQFGDDGIFHQFREIDQDKVHVFKMTSPIHNNFYSIIKPARAKLIHFYKITVLGATTDTEEKIKCYVFGFEEEGLRSNKKYLNVILPSGELVITNNPNDLKFE